MYQSSPLSTGGTHCATGQPAQSGGPAVDPTMLTPGADADCRPCLFRDHRHLPDARLAWRTPPDRDSVAARRPDMMADFCTGGLALSGVARHGGDYACLAWYQAGAKHAMRGNGAARLTHNRAPADSLAPPPPRRRPPARAGVSASKSRGGKSTAPANAA